MATPRFASVPRTHEPRTVPHPWPLDHNMLMPTPTQRSLPSVPRVQGPMTADVQRSRFPLFYTGWADIARRARHKGGPLLGQ